MADDAARFVDEALAGLAAAIDARAALRTLSLATVSADGHARLRTVILRAWDPAPPRLTLFSDTRAAKIAEIAADRRVSACAWSEAEQLQIRLEGEAAVHGAASALARRHWAALPAGGRAAYGLDAPPGAPIASPDAAVPRSDPDRAGCFAVVTVAVRRIDVLRLGSRGRQTRAVRESETTRWVAP